MGVPFSDPNADGVVIQEAMLRALKGGASLSAALDGVASLRKSGVTAPIVLFGYYNPIFVMGVSRFAEAAAKAGVDAVLTVDVPVDELEELAQPLQKAGVDVMRRPRRRRASSVSSNSIHRLCITSRGPV
jgi:tryptophan synthase alpha chain